MTPTSPVSDHHPSDGYVPFPEEFADAYRRAGYWEGRPLGELLRDAATRWPNRPALLHETGSISYEELDAEADRYAHGLLALGIRPGDRVVVQLPNVREFVLVLFGLLRAGAIPIMTLPAHREAEITHFAQLSNAVGYIAAGESHDFSYRRLAEKLRAAVPTLRHILFLDDTGPLVPVNSMATEGPALPKVAASDIAVMLVSGGTTGLPKLIARTHDDYTYNAKASAEVCGLGPDDVYLAALPVAHNFPLGCPGILGTFVTGGAVSLVTDPSPETAFAAIERHRVTVTALVPTLAQLWCAAVEWETADISSLRLLQVGGARLAEANAREVGPALGANLQQVFGMAEGLLNFTRSDDSDDIICTTQGRPLSSADEIRVVDAHDVEVAPGEEGELLTRGPYTIRGYYRAAEHNERVFTEDGYFRTGDLVRKLPSGHFIVCGRVKDVINRAGESIPCGEIEEHLVAHPEVRQAAVIGLPDPVLGEKVCAVLVVRGDGPALPEIRAFLGDRGLAPFKLPDVLRCVDALPVTSVGKIDKKALCTTLSAP